MYEFIKKHNWQLIVLLSFILLFALRAINLGYSDYNTDEATVVGYLKREGKPYSVDYLVEQRKGPMQWLVALIPFLILGEIEHEFWFRLPFALLNIFSLYFLYQFLILETKDKKLSLGIAFMVGINGFIVAFGRFLQYQSLNLFFSMLSLYFYALFFHNNNKRMSYYGSLTFSISLLSHWDAVFILPCIIYVFIKKFDLKLIILNILLIFIVTAPFVIPFLLNLSRGSEDYLYFGNRIGFNFKPNLSEVRFRTLVYNPFIFTGFLMVFLPISILVIKKYSVLWLWFLTSLMFFAFLIKAPGTHVYNLIVPTSALSVIGYYQISKLFKNEYKILPIGLFIAVLCVLYYQSYILFVDHTKEYPWEQEKVFRYKTTEFNHGDLTNHLIGFTHGRNWAETSSYINEYIGKKEDSGDYSYITNENKTISDLYMDLPYGESDKYIAVGVKNPYNFAQDYKFSQLSEKETIYKIKDKQGNTLIRIYEVIRTEDN